MTYIGVAPSNECNFLFICSTNAVFTAAHAVFDEHHFPCCPKNRREPLENPLGGVIPKPPTGRPGNTPDDIDGDDDVDHDHGYPRHQAQDDDPKCEELQAPKEEPKEPNPPRTPSSDCPQHDCRAPLCPGNVDGERQHPVEQLWDIESASRWRQTVGEASRPPQTDTPDHIPGGFPNTSATPSEEDVQKMCEEGGANLVRYLMGKALTTKDPQTENVRNWSYKDIARLPQAGQKLW
ncbi:hypothetical protein SCLCIDRAFT_106995 [Scleroderma citrinum Foug A]|uniref:Uncharacterized protein n=1 Tax=Scleroderma citrinum Foug A TaxID=1036808 RepID=A0A0C3EIR9_9AGAM|nr:hypothetical protein SCLCIDRAFT_106995 [Scleroderma citrinum Foug A]